jgi:hypothetical protein
MRELPDRADEVGIDGDIRHLRLAAAAVDDAHVSDKSVTERHGAFLLWMYTGERIFTQLFR